MSVSVTFWGNLADAASQLRETRFAESLLHGGGGQPSLRLVDAALGIGARLIHAEPALPELFLEHGDLMLGQTRARLGLPDSGGRLVLTRAHRSEERRVGEEWRSRWSPYH